MEPTNRSHPKYAWILDSEEQFNRNLIAKKSAALGKALSLARKYLLNDYSQSYIQAYI